MKIMSSPFLHKTSSMFRFPNFPCQQENMSHNMQLNSKKNAHVSRFDNHTQCTNIRQPSLQQIQNTLAVHLALWPFILTIFLVGRTGGLRRSRSRNNHQEFQVPKMEVLNLIYYKAILGVWVFPYISLTYSSYR